MVEVRKAYSIFVGKHDGRSHRRPRHRWEDIGMVLREIGWKVVDWFHLAQGRDHWKALVNTVMNLWIP
jgi:hypothetical protein